MRRTLFEIPYEIGNIPLFGWGLLLVIWGLFSLGLLAWQFRRQVAMREIAGQLPVLILVAAIIVWLPRLFPGALPIRGYGVMLLLAVTSGVGLALRRAEQMGVDQEVIFSLAFWLFVAGILGARAFHVIEYWDAEYRRESWSETLAAVANVPQGGLVVYGSLIGAAIAFVVFTRKHQLPTLAMADLVAPSLALGLALGRIGCLLNGCCYGGLCDLPWAVSFPPDSPPYNDQVARGLLDGLVLGGPDGQPPFVQFVTPGSPAAQAGLVAGSYIRQVDGHSVNSPRAVLQRILAAQAANQPVELVTDSGQTFTVPPTSLPTQSLPVHPTQIYSTINAGLLCVFLLAVYPFRRRDGEVAALLLTIYPISRFLIEIIRIDEQSVFQTGMSISQNVSLLILAGIVGMWIYLLRQPVGSCLPSVKPSG